MVSDEASCTRLISLCCAATALDGRNGKTEERLRQLSSQPEAFRPGGGLLAVAGRLNLCRRIWGCIPAPVFERDRLDIPEKCRLSGGLLSCRSHVRLLSCP